MIWVIGDIHGMFDPLKRILTTIRNLEKTLEPVEKIIFIGDYIDHGPSSKEVIELISKLEFEKVCLMGNHEDLAMRFINNDTTYLSEWGNGWLENGFLDTYTSLYDHRDKADFIQSLINLRNEPASLDNYLNNSKSSYTGYELPKKIEKFLRGLKYFHQETFIINNKEVTFSFFHGLPSKNFPLKVQKIKSYNLFTNFLDKNSKILNEDSYFKLLDVKTLYNSLLERSAIWNRDYNFEHGYEGEIIVHGHTPTCFYESYYNKNMVEENYIQQFKDFIPYIMYNLPFIFSRSPEAGYLEFGKTIHSSIEPHIHESFHYKTDSQNGLEAINIDTGAVYGQALTALGLSSKLLSQGGLVQLHVPIAGGQRSSSNKVKIRVITFDKLGGAE
jgi:hypothetical protein